MTALGLIGFDRGLVTRAVHPARTWIDGWNLSPLHQRIRGVGDLDGDGRAEAVITSDWGIGILKHDGTAFRAPFGAPRDSLFGTYSYDATTRAGRDRIVAVDDLTGSGAHEILVWNNAAMTTLALTATGLVATRLHNNGTRLGGWILSTVDNRYCGSGRFGSGRKAMVLMSPWGIGLISLDASTSLFMAPIGARLGEWTLRADDRVDLVADFDGDGDDELLIRGRSGMGILKVIDGELVAIAKHAVGSNLGGYVLEGGDTPSIAGRFGSGAAHDLLVSDLRGFHMLRLNGSQLERRAFVANGTRVDGWVVDWINNYLLAAGDLTGDGLSDFLVRSPWGLCVMSVGDDNRFRGRGGVAHGSSIGTFPLESSDLVVGAGRFLGSGRNELFLAKPTASATTPEFTPREFVNWHRNVRRTLPTVRPSNLTELVGAVRQIHSRGEVTGVAGSGWSFTDCVVGSRAQSLIDSSALNATLTGLVPDLLDDRTGDGRRLVHVEAGVKLYDLNCRLDTLGLALPTLGGSRGQSLAGVLNTGVHGGDVSLPPIADAVRAIHLVAAGGQQWWIEPAIGSVTTRRILERARARGIIDPTVKNVYDDNWFNAVLVAMGCAGVVYSVIVECRPAFRLRQTIRSESWTLAQQRIRDLSFRDRRPRFLEININPSNSSCRVTVRDETTEPDRTPPASSGPSIGAIAASVGLLGPGALGLFLGAIGSYVERTSAEIAGLGFIPFAGPVLQAQKTAELLKPVTDAHRLLIELGLAAVDPHNPRRVADVLPTAINLIWAIGAFVVSGRTLVDVLQNELTNQQRPEGTRIGKSFEVMTGQPACTSGSGEQNHDETERIVESYDYAVSTSRCIALIDRLIAVIAEQRRGSDAIVVNLNLRFTGRTRATLGMSKFDSTCHVEVYTFRGLRGNDAFKRRLHEVVSEFDAIPHLGQLHLPNEAAAAFRDIGALERWQTAIRAISGSNQMFWSSFGMERGFLP